MLSRLEWRIPEDRSRDKRLTILYKISKDQVAINNYYKTDRLVPPNRQTKNTHSRTVDPIKVNLHNTSSDYHKGSFPRTMQEWNTLPPDIVASKTAEAFKTHVSKIKY